MLTNEYVRRTANKPIKGNPEILFLYSDYVITEPKIDGERNFLEFKDGEVVLANMHNTVYDKSILSQDFIEAVISGLKADSVILDGEYHVTGGDFYAFLSNRLGEGAHRVAYAVFDILYLNGEYVGDRPLMERKRLLDRVIEPNKRIFPISYQIVHHPKGVRELFRVYCEEGYEGIVVKPNSSYNSTWVKLRREETRDVVILGIKKTEGFLKDGIARTFLIGVWDGDRFRPIGYVSSGLSLADKEALTSVLLDFCKEGEDREHIYVKPRICLEISYYKRMKNGLRFPKILRPRFDKPPKECRW